jgi:CelD/BcsL family acetyltransferase involved in cellulose biosynthesis
VTLLARHDQFEAAFHPGHDEPAPVADGLAVEIRLLEEIPADWHHPWDRLAATAAEPNAFAERWMMLAAARHLRPAGATRMIAVWRGTGRSRALIGLMPVRIERGYAHLPIRFVQNWRHHHNFLGTPLVAAGREVRFWTALLGALDAAPWASGFFHLNKVVEDGPVHRGLKQAAARLGRPCDIVQRSERAMLASALSADAYYQQAVRKKKRKELKRLSARLAELGAVAFERLGADGDANHWCEQFLSLEASGWKGRQRSALALDPATEAFFRDVFAGARAADRLEALRLSLDGRPIAMLVSFLTPPGAFSFKIAIDEDFARFSPGVLIQIENLAVLGRPDIAWTDSCAVEDHAMINSLWRGRRSIVRVSVPLAGRGRRTAFALARMVEGASALLRRRSGARGATAHDMDCEGADS